jgi:hypothetical protein
MKFLVHFVVIVILVRQSMSNWVLKWEDEFDNETVDTNKWEIENESGHCKGIFFLFEMRANLVLCISMVNNNCFIQTFR